MAHKYKPVSYSESSRSASRVTCDDENDYSRSYAESIHYIDRLLKHPNEKITTEPYEGIISRLEFLYYELSEREQKALKAYLGKRCLSTTAPGTVGAYLCGCFKQASFYPGGDRECSALCAGSIFEEKKCEKTVVLWTTDDNGSPIAKVLSRGNTSCNVYIDPRFPQVNDSIKQSMLLGSGCSEATFFSSTSQFQPEIPQQQQPLPIPEAQRKPITGSQVQRALQLQETQETNYWWVWLIAIFLFLIIIGVIIYLYVRGT